MEGSRSDPERRETVPLEFTAHVEKHIELALDPVDLFDALDDHARLSGHMAETSWMMGGGRMRLELDERQGRAVGSLMKVEGSAFGLRLSLAERVTERVPPKRKVWETCGTTDLVVIGDYRMGFDIAGRDGGSHLTIWVDFARSPKHPLLSHLLGRSYARWCVDQMLGSAKALVRERSV